MNPDRRQLRLEALERRLAEVERQLEARGDEVGEVRALRAEREELTAAAARLRWTLHRETPA